MATVVPTLAVVTGPPGGMVIQPLTRAEVLDLVQCVDLGWERADGLGKVPDARRLRALLVKLRPLIEASTT